MSQKMNTRSGTSHKSAVSNSAITKAKKAQIQYSADKVLDWMQSQNRSYETNSSIHSESFDTSLNTSTDIEFDNMSSVSHALNNSREFPDFNFKLPSPLKPRTFKPTVLSDARAESDVGEYMSSVSDEFSTQPRNDFYFLRPLPLSQPIKASTQIRPIPRANSPNSLDTQFAPMRWNLSAYDHFNSIQTYLDHISEVNESLPYMPPSIIGSDTTSATVDQGTQTDFVELEPQEPTPTVTIFDFARSYNPNSIDALLAFHDIKKFVQLVHEENELFESELNLSQHLDRQLEASQEDLSVSVEANRDYSIDNTLPINDRVLQKSLNGIFEDESFKASTVHKRNSVEITRNNALTCIRELFSQLNTSLENNAKTLVIKVRNTSTWGNLAYKNGILVVKDANVSKYSQLRGRKGIVLYILRCVYGLLTLNTKLTKRSIYYQLKPLLTTQTLSQDQVNAAVLIVGCILNIPQWNLNVLSTSKGLVHGDLTLTIGGTKIECNACSGTIIPADLNDLRAVRTNAYFVLIVEKDSVFQKLLADNLPNKLARKFILVTGKGYADIPTRRFLNILWKLLDIPMFIVVDADAYGIDIMLTYKFGSMASSYMSEELSLPKLRWLGILPSEIASKKPQIKTMKLAPLDQRKMKAMLQRPYFANGQNAPIQEEIKALLKNKEKCEIEGVFITPNHFSNYYMFDKFVRQSFV